MDTSRRPEAEPGGGEALANVQSLLTTTPEIFGEELFFVQNSLDIANGELSKEGAMSPETIEILNDYWNEFRPRTEIELREEIDSATELLKKELEGLEYPEDSLEEISGNFKRIVEIIATTNKNILPHRVVQEYMKNFIMY
jgi:hypothetical protein